MEELVEQTITKQTFTDELKLVREFYKCTFEQCDFQNAVLVDLIFTNCEFKACNLSNVSLKSTQLIMLFLITVKSWAYNLISAVRFPFMSISAIPFWIILLFLKEI